VVKNLPANAGDTGDTSSIPGSGRSPGGGNGNPLQHSCLGIPMNRRARWATVHEITKSQTRLRMHAVHLELILNSHFKKMKIKFKKSHEIFNEKILTAFHHLSCHGQP